MLSLVLTNRNRDLKIVNKCLASLNEQSNKDFELFFVDYGSNENYLLDLEKVISQYAKIKFISCPVSGQLWNKSRAINIALKECTTPFFMVGDIDLIFAPDFMNTVSSLVKNDEVHYFQYGFLSQEESLKNKKYESYLVDFKGNHEVTGTSVFPSLVLKKIGGYDEFYHGWGAEDTDIHLRMSNLGLKVLFYDKEVLVKHQWHPKIYRSKSSPHPFHSLLERINSNYMMLSDSTKRTIINQDIEWGKIPKEEAYEKLKNYTLDEIVLTNSKIDIASFLSILRNFKNEVISVKINEVTKSIKNKNVLRMMLKKKYIPFLEMEEVNNLILEEIIRHYRNQPYQYIFDREKRSIQIKISFQS